MNEVTKTLKEVEKTLNGLLESMAGEKAKAIEEAIGKLSEVDVEIRKALDEIEPIKQEDFEMHNKLSEETNKLIDEAASGHTEEEDEEEPDEERPKRIVIRVHGVIRPMPIPVPFFPFGFLPF